MEGSFEAFFYLCLAAGKAKAFEAFAVWNRIQFFHGAKQQHASHLLAKGVAQRDVAQHRRKRVAKMVLHRDENAARAARRVGVACRTVSAWASRSAWARR